MDCIEYGKKEIQENAFEAKTACYSKQVKDCRGDIKGLYKMVNTLMGTTLENPLPNHTSNKDLAEEFADFFMDKIQKLEITSMEIQHMNPQRKLCSDLLNSGSLIKLELKRPSLV